MSYESVLADAKDLSATERYMLAMELLKGLKTLIVEETELKTVKKVRNKAKKAAEEPEKPKRAQSDAQILWRQGVKHVADRGKEYDEAFNYKKSLTLCGKVLVDGVNLKSLESWPEPSDEEIQTYLKAWTDTKEDSESQVEPLASEAPSESEGEAPKAKRGRKKLADMTEEERKAHTQKVEAKREARKAKA